MKYELKYEKQPIKMMDLFLARGITLENLHKFCKPQRDTNYLEPTLLDNMDKGVSMLKHHVESLHKIDLIVDCDVDGYTSAAQMYLFIKKIEPDIEIRYHLHEGKQHGLEDQIDKLTLLDDVYLVICPDSGR